MRLGAMQVVACGNLPLVPVSPRQGISDRILRPRAVLDNEVEVRQNPGPADLAVTEIACG